MGHRNRVGLTEQEILNFGLDVEDVNPPTSLRGQLEWTGTGWVRKNSGLMAKKITTSGDNTYVACAVMGSAQASAVWQVKKISVSGSDTVITWADGDSNFDNVATDLTVLTYL